MNGARALLRTLVASGVDVCFANPGTSEMHFVAALDDEPGMRAVLALFEGVATGAADGFARMTGLPGAALLHLGPGLGNGLANLHNARRARVPVLAIVGDHAGYHHRYDSQLESDIATVARNVSTFVRTADEVERIAEDALDAVDAALGPPATVATLILPADTSWSEGAAPAAARARTAPRAPSDAAVRAARDALRSGEPAALLLGGTSLRARPLRAAAASTAATGARLLGETFPARLERGAGIAAVERVAYLAEFAEAQLGGLRNLVLVDAPAPVSFFAYPGRPSDLVPQGCTVTVLAGPGEDATAALEALAAALGADPATAPVAATSRPAPPTGPLTGEAVAQALGALLPEGAIVSDEANTSGLWMPAATAGAPPHDWLTLTGGAIGQGLPVAVGAAVAAPGRPVVALEADGSAMYTLQALWTMAREQLDITVIIFNNRSYSILAMELNRVGAGTPGPRARSMLDLAAPALDFVALAGGMGVPASRATTGEELTDQLARALAEPGPHLIDAVVPAVF